MRFVLINARRQLRAPGRGLGGLIACAAVVFAAGSVLAQPGATNGSGTVASGAPNLAPASASEPGAMMGMLGYAEGHSAGEREVEQRFDAQVNPTELSDWLKSMSSAPNQVGSPHDRANAEFMLQKLREWGWDAHIETFSVLYPTPKHESLKLTAPHKF